MFTKIVVSICLTLATLFASIGIAQAQGTYRWKAVATSRPTPQFELWTWLAEELDRRTGGQIKVEVTSLPELGLTGLEMMRVTRAGLVDIADVSPTYVSGDLPVIEGVDLPGLFPDFETSAKAHRAFLAVIKKHEDKIGAVVLGGYLWAETVIFSRKPLRTPADFKGLKIRVFGAALTDLARAMGMEPVSVPFAEVYSALERGTIDASFTGTYAGYSLKWYEVTKYLVEVNLGPSSGIFAVSKRSWDLLTPALRDTLLKLGEDFTDRGIEVSRRTTKEGIDRCRENGMEVISLTPTVSAVVKEGVTKAVIPNWIKRSGPDARATFDQFIAPYAGFKAP